MSRYQQELEERTKNNLLRVLPGESAGIDFYSNDYLGLARSEELLHEVEKEYRSLPSRKIGSTGSRLLSGNSEYAESVEKAISNFHQTASALLFSSGYSANVGLLSALGKRGVTFVCDELIHASMIDGVRLSHANRVRFNHNDVKDLEIKLSGIEGDKIVLVESIYSMDGDITPLSEILAVAKKHSAELIVDEAHAIGVAGEFGEGYCTSLGIQEEVLATVATFGKAMGTHGAVVLGKKWLINYLLNFARSFIYSTAPSDHQLASIRCSYRKNEKSQELRHQLFENIQYFISKRETFAELRWLDSKTCIQSLIIPGNENVIQVAKFLESEGMTILPIRSPSVPEGQERLRISLHAYNTKEEIDLFFETIGKWNHNE